MSLCSWFILPFGKVMFLLLGVFGLPRLRSLWFVPSSMLVHLFLRLGRGAAEFGHVPIGGRVVGKLRSDLGSGDGQSVHLFKDASVSRVILLRRRLGCVLSVLNGISGHGLTLSRRLELGAQWDAVVAAGSGGPLGSADIYFSCCWPSSFWLFC